VSDRTLLEPPTWGALGHIVRLLPPSYVKAYLKRNKNDANDAAASTRSCRLRCNIKPDCCSADLAATNRIDGRVTASQMAAASLASFLLRKPR